MNLKTLYEYDNTIFSDMVFPEDADEELCVLSILVNAGLMTPIYNDPYTNKKVNAFWAKSNLFNFTQVWNALNTEYNPIENYDRYTDAHRDINDTGRYDSNSNGSTTGTVAPFDSDSWRNSDKTNSETNAGSTSESDKKDNFTEHVHGNIGVTTAQQMINQEIELRKQSFYKWLADRYIEENCLGVY